MYIYIYIILYCNTNHTKLPVLPPMDDSQERIYTFHAPSVLIRSTRGGVTTIIRHQMPPSACLKNAFIIGVDVSQLRDRRDHFAGTCTEQLQIDPPLPFSLENPPFRADFPWFPFKKCDLPLPGQFTRVSILIF